MAGELIVVALGGNAIKQAHESGTTEEQFKNVDDTAAQIAGLVKMGYRVVVTHGNGPQAGSLLIQQEEADSLVPAQTLAVCGAMTQGQIGWMLQNRLAVHLKKNGLDNPVCTVVTQVEVSDEDPDFQDPSKPVGPFYTKDHAQSLEKDKGYIVREVKPGTEKGWRRVVPSPEPIDIVEQDAIRTLVEASSIVIASGGGGIPVKKNPDGSYTGVEAVIDKDRAGFKLAQAVEAKKFMILTDVEQVSLNFGKPDQKDLGRLSVAEAEGYLNDGHFLKGSMGPKVQACLRFVKWSGKEAVITSLHKAGDALAGKTGTHIVP
ncbi:MAG: carbamate kinase [Spirochaetes bacterium]|jgi:carbamate kinase|nr:carbamate kinase [Spirochaetota bacterium]